MNLSGIHCLKSPAAKALKALLSGVWGVCHLPAWFSILRWTSFMKSAGVTSSASHNLKSNLTLGLFRPSSISDM